MDDLIKTFKSFDKNGNGTISKEELIEGYRGVYGDMSDEDVMNEVNEVMNRLDIDGNGQIDYSEWAIGTVNKQDILTKDKL